MTIATLKKRFLELIKNQNALQSRHLTDFTELPEIYVALYDKYPDSYFIDCDIDLNKSIEQIKKKIDCFTPGSYDVYKKNKDNDKYEYHDKVYDYTTITTKGLVCMTHGGIFIYTNDKKFKDEIVENLQYTEEEYPCQVYWVSQGQNGFGASKLTLKNGKFNIKTHYNNDFDYDKIQDFINSDSSGLVILHGTSGTGKTFCIRNLAQENPDKKFYFLDKSTFEYINSDSLVNFLFKDLIKNSIFVLEDCETLLADRMDTGNHLLSTILNLSDGILGDGLNLKFICTFNADISKLDDAILRKGRMKYKYEFKELTPEKTQELAKELNKNIPEGKSLTVSDIYNWDENTGKDAESKKIGF